MLSYRVRDVESRHACSRCKKNNYMHAMLTNTTSQGGKFHAKCFVSIFGSSHVLNSSVFVRSVHLFMLFYCRLVFFFYLTCFRH